MKHVSSLLTKGAIQRSSICCWGNALAVASQHPSCDIVPTANPPNESKHFTQRLCHRGTWLPTCARTVRPFQPASRRAYSEEETPALKWRAEEKHERTHAPIDFVDHLRQASTTRRLGTKWPLVKQGTLDTSGFTSTGTRNLNLDRDVDA